MNKILADIFSDDIFSSKLSVRVNYIIIGLIVISTLEIILQTEPSLENFKWLFNAIYFSTSIFFLLELILRYWVAGLLNKRFNGVAGKFFFTFSFYTIIDIAAVFPFLLGLFGVEALVYLKAIRVLRILKIIRYMPSVDLLQRAVYSKKAELLISLQVIFITAILLSIGLFYSESKVENTQFSSIPQALLWSVAKFIGGIAGYGSFDPVTSLGKFLATLNGVLGIAIFALPAGIIASGFISEIETEKHKNEIQIRIAEINNYFESTYKRKIIIDKRIGYARFSTFENLQTRLLYSDAELLECVRNSENLRFRAMKSSDNIKYNDTKLIEYFRKNSSYGCTILNEESNVYIINPVGATERCISHFTFTIIDNLGYNYISREIKLHTNNGDLIKSNKSQYYLEDFHNNSLLPSQFADFINDIKGIKATDYVIVLSSGASGRADFIIEYGNKKGIEPVEIGVSTFYDTEKLEKVKQTLKNYAKEITSKTAKATEFKRTFTIENHAIGNFEDDWVGKAIHKLTGANVITIYVNISLLTGEDESYYASLKCLLLTLESVFGNYK